MTLIVVACLAIGLWWRIERLATQRLADSRALREQTLADERVLKERELKIKEDTLAFERDQRKVNDGTSDIPADIMEWCLSESEVWAQEDAKRIVRELYTSHGGDWDKVRHRMSSLIRNSLAVNERSVLPH